MLSSFAAALLVLAPGQSPEPPPFVKEYARAVPYYYKSPDPALGPKMLKELLKEENLRHPLFTKDNNYVLMLNAAVLGDIARGQPKVVREYEDAYADASPAGRKVIVRALENCGDGDTVKWIGDRTELAALKAQLEDKI